MILLIALLMQVESQESLPPETTITQAKLDEMSATCRTPRKWLKHRGGNEVQFRPSRWAKYEQVDCVLKQLRASLVPMNFGFVGNEAVTEK